MTYGTGPQALVDHFSTNWQATRTGRPDLPEITTDYRSTAGTVFVTNDRSVIADNQQIHDLLHCYHPQADALAFTDRGYDEKNVVETVQIDIEATDRTDPDTGERLSAKDRLVGDRDDANFPTDESPPYPGLLGEVVYLLETIRRDFEEWDVARMDVLNLFLGNSDASAAVSVDLEHIAQDTVV